MQDEKPDLDTLCAAITALFLDHLVYDISDAEWTQLQKRLAETILKIQNMAIIL